MPLDLTDNTVRSSAQPLYPNKMRQKMQIKKLNGWQRLWVLSSVIWLITVLFIAVSTYPTKQNTFIGDDEVMKNLSDKTIKILAKPGGVVGKYSNIRSVETLPNGLEFSVASGMSQADIDYVRNDYTNVDNKIVNKKRISFIWQMAMFWIAPCIVIYVIGLSLNWVYRGFKKEQ